MAATDGLNFGNPQEPTPAWQFHHAVRGIAHACEVLGTPVVSGNVSFYNQSSLGEVLPTPLIGVLGLIEDVTKAVGSVCAPGQRLYLIRYEHPEPRQGGLGASSFLSSVHGVDAGVPVAPSLEAERHLDEALVTWIASGDVQAAHDVSDGGLAVCLAEMTVTEGLGAEVDLDPIEGLAPESLLFGEWPGWVVVAASDASAESLTQAAENSNLLIVKEIGRSTPEGRLIIRQNNQVLVDVSALNAQNWHKKCFDRVFKT